MNADTIKLVFTYTIALVIIVGGGIFLFATIGNKDAESSRLAVVGFMGAAITFVFTSEAATRATRAAQSSSASGAATVTGVTPPPPNPVEAG
jgi:small-conductance mechanosensitive channel